MHLDHFEAKSNDLGLEFLLNKIDTCLEKHNHINVSYLWVINFKKKIETIHIIFFSPYWWPTIDEDIKYHSEYECEECMLELNEKQEEMNLKNKQTTTLKEMSPSDWKKPYIEYLLFGKVISEDLTGEENERIANRSQFFTIMNGKLMR
jgi:uncharacterized protein involved in tolerance to divalent cations